MEQLKKSAEMIRARLECLTRETSGTNDDCNFHKCDNCEFNYAQGNVAEQKEWMRIAINSLEAWNRVIEKMQKLRGCTCYASDGIIDDIEDIINKCLSEVEE